MSILRRVHVNTAKQKMREGRPAYGYGISLGSPFAAQLLSRSGIDWILLDTQHGAWGHDAAFAALMAMAGGTATPIARVARNDYTLIGKLLDQGALGIVVPMVHSPELARDAADACRLPPAGTRSWGVGQASVYGSDYFDWINEQVFVAVQIESIQAVERAEAIMATDGIDGCWAGPADLALSMGLDPRRASEDDRHARALEKILAACRNTGKAPGLACASPADARQRADQGWQFLTAGTEAGFMLAGARAGLEVFSR